MQTTMYAGKGKPWSLCLPRVPLLPLHWAGNSRTDLHIGVPREAITPSPTPHLTAVRCIKHISQNAGSTHTSFARTPADLRALWQHLQRLCAGLFCHRLQTNHSAKPAYFRQHLTTDMSVLPCSYWKTAIKPQ